MLYADAVTRAKSFDPCAVVEALEGFEFDGMGNGPTLYRAEDHQCFKDVVVVRGKENPENEFDLVEIVEVTPVEQVTYAPDHPQFRRWRSGQLQLRRLIYRSANENNRLRRPRRSRQVCDMCTTQ